MPQFSLTFERKSPGEKSLGRAAMSKNLAAELFDAFRTHLELNFNPELQNGFKTGSGGSQQSLKIDIIHP